MRIEKMNFERLTECELLADGYETLEDLKKIDYETLMKNKKIYNAIIIRVHQAGEIMDFEPYYYSIIKKRLKNKEHIKIEELTISPRTKKLLHEFGIDYLEELQYFNIEEVEQRKQNEAKEVEWLIKILGIKKDTSKKGIKTHEVELSTKAKLTLKALNVNNIKEYLFLSDDEKEYIDQDVKEELDSIVDRLYGNSKITPIEIELEDIKLEVKNLQKEVKLKEKQIGELKSLQQEKVIYENRLNEINKRLKKTIKEASKSI